MVLPRETILTGAALTCSDCGVTPELKVCHSPAGYYLGTYCECGPYSRESEYFKTRELAEKALASGAWTPVATEQPQFVHDCDHCTFLGRWHGSVYNGEEAKDYDLYVCVHPGNRNLDSWLARYGNHGSEYLSSHPPMAFAQPYVQTPWAQEVARRISKQKGSL